MSNPLRVNVGLIHNISADKTIYFTVHLKCHYFLPLNQAVPTSPPSSSFCLDTLSVTCIPWHPHKCTIAFKFLNSVSTLAWANETPTKICIHSTQFGITSAYIFVQFIALFFLFLFVFLKSQIRKKTIQITTGMMLRSQKDIYIY